MRHSLKNTWVLWYHDIENPNYNIDDYLKIIEIETVEDFWVTFNQISDVSNGMFFLMRKGVTPQWDHPININGGTWKFKIKKSDANTVWINVALTLIGETISDKSEKIVGLSISPKYQNVTIRVWNSESQRYGHYFSGDIDPHIIFKNGIYELNSQYN